MAARAFGTFSPRHLARAGNLGRWMRLLALPAALALVACEPELGQGPDSAPNETAPSSCANQCGATTPQGASGCTCDSRCVAKGNCCADYTTACGSKPFAAGSCAGVCGSPNDQGGCYCDTECALWGDCCADLATTCGGAQPPGGLPPGGLPGQPGLPGTGTCAGKCGNPDDQGGCYCNTDCAQWGDCCADYATSCGGGLPGQPGQPGQPGLPGTGTCAGKCGNLDDQGGCYCSTDCAQWGDCCADYATSCGGGLPGQPGLPGNGTCAGKCGNLDDQGGCYCDWDCAQFGDCCANFATACP